MGAAAVCAHLVHDHGRRLGIEKSAGAAVGRLAALLTWYGDACYFAKRRALRRRYERLAAALAHGPEGVRHIDDPLSMRVEASAADFWDALRSPMHLTLYGTVIALSGGGSWYR
jgi:hypothetical protein